MNDEHDELFDPDDEGDAAFTEITGPLPSVAVVGRPNVGK
jgi:hypothetical protein